MRLRFHTYDVFTDTPFAGNPLAIVEGADGLNTAQMQTMAREFNLSETIFVMAPQDAAHTAKVRIFFPTAEIPFAGHPTIGCALHLAQGRDCEITLEEEAGLVPVTIQNNEAEFTAPVTPFARPIAPDVSLTCAALDLGTLDLAGDAPIAVHEGGPAFLYVPVAGLSALERARPMEPHWTQLMTACGVDSAYIYAPHKDGYRARMFSPTAGIPEDPATGSASAILASQLMTSGILQNGETVIALAQGVEMGRPSQIRMTATVADGALQSVRIAGRAVPISQGEITVP
ncbi:PhzF family phenazine biosynthesis protein [Cognatishimia sp. MH4019]|uniref:PhzF family phenazine biosynthesis protein n=1 Tax=Cognatishimia sp. MH4019 TaxID=2854030 RepID=UPI001CD7E25C|nr:PhzF family phenazine biosynthesis protein [Cognatishimia sp. MH4019]